MAILMIIDAQNSKHNCMTNDCIYRVFSYHQNIFMKVLAISIPYFHIHPPLECLKIGVVVVNFIINNLIIFNIHLIN